MAADSARKWGCSVFHSRGADGSVRFFWSSALLLFLEVGVDQGADELSASALHLGDDGLNVVRSGTIKVGGDADVLVRRSCVQD